MVLGLRTLGKGLRAGAGVAAGTAKAVAWVAVGTVMNVGRVVLAAKAAVTRENREESFSGKKELVALANPEAELTQPEEGANSSDAVMTPVPEEAFEPAKAEVVEMGAESVLEAGALASTAEVSSLAVPAGAGKVSGCAEEVTTARVSVSEKGVVQMECQQDQESLLRTASLGEGAVSQGGAEVGTGAAAPEALPSAEEGQELVAQSAVLGSVAGVGAEEEKEAEMKGQEEGVEQGTVAASTPEVGVQQVGATQPHELPAGAIPNFGAKEGELAPELQGEVGFDKVTFSGSAQELKRQWEALTGYKGLPETTVLHILQHAAKLQQKKHKAGACLLDITPANIILKDFTVTAYPIWGGEIKAGSVASSGSGEGIPVARAGGVQQPVGTWAYMALELRLKDRRFRQESFGEHIFFDFPAGPACDIFSLARTAQELLPPCASRYTRGLLNRMTDEFPEDRPTAIQLRTLLAIHPLLSSGRKRIGRAPQQVY